jgi:hypothetical protein
VIPPEKWDACALPVGFTAADGVALMAIESGLTLQPWQFDYLARFFPETQQNPRPSP